MHVYVYTILYSSGMIWIDEATHVGIVQANEPTMQIPKVALLRIQLGQFVGFIGGGNIMTTRENAPYCIVNTILLKNMSVFFRLREEVCSDLRRFAAKLLVFGGQACFFEE